MGCDHRGKGDALGTMDLRPLLLLVLARSVRQGFSLDVCPSTLPGTAGIKAMLASTLCPLQRCFPFCAFGGGESPFLSRPSDLITLQLCPLQHCFHFCAFGGGESPFFARPWDLITFCSCMPAQLYNISLHPNCS